MKWCSKCVLPSTRPELTIGDDGVCSACKMHEEEKQVDWMNRQREWADLVTWAKLQNKPYDCLLPVSGGKDSAAQAVCCLNAGLHPLAVTWKSPRRTPLGTCNLDVIRELGMDHIDLSINPKVERIMYRKSFEQLGSDAVLHLAVYANVPKIAYLFDIPLVLWSENSAVTYSGSEETADLRGPNVTNEWVMRLGSTQGRKAEDYLGDGITERDLYAYWLPTDEQLASKNIKQIFIGHYFNWSGYENYQIAKQYGFKAADEPLVGWYNFCDLDCPFIVAHHAGKLWKYGFSRVSDNLSLEIREGRMTREQALVELRKNPGYIHQESLQLLCEFVERPVQWFYDTMEKFRNLDIWEKHPDGYWWIPNYVIPDLDWNGVGQAKW